MTRRKRFFRVGTLGNLAATGWQAILAALLLAAVPAGLGWELVALPAAGFVLLFFGWLLGAGHLGAAVGRRAASGRWSTPSSTCAWWPRS